jgi:hypothetical protein
VWWACGPDPRGRYGSLAEFAERHGLVDDAALWRKASAALAR